MPNSMVNWLAGPPPEQPAQTASPYSNLPMLQQELGPTPHDATQSHAGRRMFLRTAADLNPVVGTFNNAITDAVARKDAVTYGPALNWRTHSDGVWRQRQTCCQLQA